MRSAGRRYHVTSVVAAADPREEPREAPNTVESDDGWKPVVHAMCNTTVHGKLASPSLREVRGCVGWVRTWWAHTGGGNALAFKQPT
jgi:hypothetical protein